MVNRDVYYSHLTNRAITVFLYLSDRADKNGICFPSVKTIANDLNLSVRTVQRAIKDLKNAKMIKAKKRVRLNGGRSSTMYVLRYVDRE